MAKKGIRGRVIKVRQTHALKNRGFLKSQWVSLLYGPGGRGAPQKFAWDIRVEDDTGQTWTVNVRGLNLEGGVELGDTIFIPGAWKRGNIVKCRRFINESAGGITVMAK